MWTTQSPPPAGRLPSRPGPKYRGSNTRGFDPDPAASERLAGFLPGHDRVLVALGAAHGFKFAPVLGRVLADLALQGGTEVDISGFAADRPALTAAEPEARYLV